MCLQLFNKVSKIACQLTDLKMLHELTLFLYQVIPRTFIFFFINFTKSSFIFRLAFPAFLHINLSKSTVLACETSSPSAWFIESSVWGNHFFGFSVRFIFHPLWFVLQQDPTMFKLKIREVNLLIHNLHQRYLIN